MEITVFVIVQNRKLLKQKRCVVWINMRRQRTVKRARKQKINCVENQIRAHHKDEINEKVQFIIEMCIFDGNRNEL